MRQVVDSSGIAIKGLFRRTDDSLVVVNHEEFVKNKISHDAFEALNNEVMTLRKQVNQILESLNGNKSNI